MSISLTCPECSGSFKVNDALEGKRVRCKHCQAAVRVSRTDDLGQEGTDSISADLEEDQDLPRRKRSKKRNNESSPSSWHNFLMYASRNPWVGIVLIFLLIWLPLSFVFTKQIIAIDVIIVLLAMLGCAIGTLLALLGVAMKNPFELITTFVAAALLSQVTSTPGQAGRIAGNLSNRAGMKNIGGADTGAAGRMVIYCGGVLIVFLVHVTALSFVLVSRLK